MKVVKMAYEHEHKLRDGAVLVYARSQSKSGIYQARIKVPETDGYVVRSLKTATLSDALRRAEDLYDELRFAQKQGLDITAAEMRFKSLWQRFYKAHEVSLSIHRQKLHKGNATRYFVPFLGDHKASDIPDMTIEKYWDWRINFYTEKANLDGSKNKIPANAALMPAQKTLDMEAGMLRQIFRWGKRMGFVKREPWVKSPKVKHDKGVSRRPTFSNEEWRIIYRYLRKWSAEKITVTEGLKGGKLHRKGPHALHRYQREMLRNYVLFMANSGLRPNEARQLRWRDIRIEADEDKVNFLAIEVSPSTKTGARTVVCLQEAEKYLERIRNISEHTAANDLIFCDKEGKSIESFNKTFMKVLIELNLLDDRWGARRSIYSLRHFYCTQTLLADQASILLVAQNMGTSVSYIQKHYSHIFTLQKAKALSRKSLVRRKV